MKFKVRGNVVLFEALEIKANSALILNDKNREYKAIVTHVGNLVEGFSVGDEIILRNNNVERIMLDNHIYGITNPNNILAIVEDNDAETYSYEQTIERQLESPILDGPKDLILPHNIDYKN